MVHAHTIVSLSLSALLLIVPNALFAKEEAESMPLNCRETFNQGKFGRAADMLVGIVNVSSPPLTVDRLNGFCPSPEECHPTYYNAEHVEDVRDLGLDDNLLQFEPSDSYFVKRVGFQVQPLELLGDVSPEMIPEDSPVRSQRSRFVIDVAGTNETESSCIYEVLFGIHRSAGRTDFFAKDVYAYALNQDRKITGFEKLAFEGFRKNWEGYR